MRYDLHLRATIQNQIDQLAEKMKSWEDDPKMDEGNRDQIRERLVAFNHTSSRDGLRIAGVDGSGDFPALSYSDSFIYISIAHGTVYISDSTAGLKEIGPEIEPLVHFTWLPENEAANREALDEAFSYLSGSSIEQVIEVSDYRTIRQKRTHKADTVKELAKSLIRPNAADAGNIGLQLRSTAELGAALRILRSDLSPKFLLIDGTLSLPLVEKTGPSLFYEHLKRLCCVEAQQKGVAFFAISKSLSLPNIDSLEELVREKYSAPKQQKMEHWLLRLPIPDIDEWPFPLSQERKLPPIGVVTYLVRFHRTTPLLRLDMDINYWLNYVRGASDKETLANEFKIFEDLDYSCHDQRCYGYPYPIKAGHDRASLTQAERIALRKQVIDAAVKAGMKRALFRDPGVVTG